MDSTQLQNYLLPLAIVVFLGWRFFRFRGIRAQLPQLLKDGAVIVDVRSTGEFLGAHNDKSINIPLDELDSKAKQLDRQKTIVVCCASGSRSAVASSLLKRQGFTKVINAGPWRNTVVG